MSNDSKNKILITFRAGIREYPRLKMNIQLKPNIDYTKFMNSRGLDYISYENSMNI